MIREYTTLEEVYLLPTRHIDAGNGMGSPTLFVVQTERTGKLTDAHSLRVLAESPY